MFKNIKITVQDDAREDFKLVLIYEDLEAQMYVSSSPLTGKIIEGTSESTNFNLIYFLVDKENKDLRIGQLITFVNHFGVSEKYRIANLELIPFFSREDFIQIKADKLDG